MCLLSLKNKLHTVRGDRFSLKIICWACLLHFENSFISIECVRFASEIIFLLWNVFASLQKYFVYFRKCSLCFNVEESTFIIAFICFCFYIVAVTTHNWMGCIAFWEHIMAFFSRVDKPPEDIALPLFLMNIKGVGWMYTLFFSTRFKSEFNLLHKNVLPQSLRHSAV